MKWGVKESRYLVHGGATGKVEYFLLMEAGHAMEISIRQLNTGAKLSRQLRVATGSTLLEVTDLNEVILRESTKVYLNEKIIIKNKERGA